MSAIHERTLVALLGVLFLLAGCSPGVMDIAQGDDGNPGDPKGDDDSEGDDADDDDADDDVADDDVGDDDSGADDDATPSGDSPIEIESDCDACGSDLLVHHEPYSGQTPLRIIGIYETDAPHHTMGDCQVHVEMDQEVVLVLSAYEPVHWIVDEVHAGSIQEIIVDHYYTPQVTAPPGVPVTTISGWWSSAYDWYDCDARFIVEEMEAMTGLPLTSFAGCYHANEFWLMDGSGPPVEDTGPDCADVGESFAGPDTSVLGNACSQVTSESYWCLTLTTGGYAVLGLDSGDMCTFLPYADGGSGGVSSLSWRGPYVYASSGPWGNMQQHSLVDGTVETAFVYGGSVTTYDGGILASPGGECYPDLDHWVTWYPTFLDAQCGTGTPMPGPSMHSRMAVDGDTLYSAWHSTDTIETYDLLTGAALGDIPLDNYDTWVNGMSVIDGMLVLAATWPEDRVVVFDAQTGTTLWQVPQSDSVHGLVCRSAL